MSQALAKLFRIGAAPDGLTIDDRGHIWVAVYDGWAVYHYSPDGSLLERVKLPVSQVTSCAFGAADRGSLSEHTAGVNLEPERGK
jgi:sugar lactone lactonase YvrE